MLDKAIEHGHERRRPYRKSKAFDRACRNHGSCPWCRDDRLHSGAVREAKAKNQERDLYDEGNQG